MNSSELLLTPETLNRISVLFVYLPTGAIASRLLIPRLSRIGKLLALSMLVAQVFVIAISLEIRPMTLYEDWLWSIDAEFNIASILASTQLIAICGVAVVSSISARSKPFRLRLFLALISLVFLILSLDEFFSPDEFFDVDRSLGLSVLGGVVVLITLLTALRSSRRSRFWHMNFLTGLSLMAFGGIVLDHRPLVCGALRSVSTATNCPEFFYLEEALELAGGWLALVAMLGWFSESVPPPNLLVRRAILLLPALWIPLLVQASPIPKAPNYSLGAIQRAAVEFESGEYLYGYRVKVRDGFVDIQLYTFPWRNEAEALGYSVHLVDQVSGRSVAKHDSWLERHRVFSLFGGTFVRVHVQDLDMDILPEMPLNRALSAVLSLWREGDDNYIRQKIVSSDLKQLSDTQVILGEFVIPAPPATSAGDPLALFDNGFSLDAVTLPETVRAGATLNLTFTWRSDTPGSEDHIQFLHLGHAESGEWWVYDQQPLGARLPTRLWYSGLADSEVWSVPLPADLAPGRYDVFTGLYRARDGERVPATDAEGAPWLDNRVAIGSLTVE